MSYTFISQVEGTTVSITTDQVDITDILREVRSFLLASGFHPNTVEIGFETIVEENNSETAKG